MFEILFQTCWKILGKSMEKDGNVDCRRYLLVCQRSIANLRGSNRGGCSQTLSNIKRIEI